MLQTMREKSKSWVTFVVVGVIAFMMAITGLESLAPNPNNSDVAKVNGEEISRFQLNQSIDQQRRAMIQQMGERFDPSLIDDKLLQENVLNSLIERSLLLQAAQSGKMDVSDASLDQLIISIPEFQQDGQFNQERFQMVLRSVGMTPLQFRSVLREDILMNQMQSGIAGSEFVTAAEIRKLNSLERQTRDIAWLTLKADKVRDSIQPSEDEIATYYESHSDRFMTEEQVVIQYVEMKKADLKGDIEISDQELRDEYHHYTDQLKETSRDKQQVSTILIETGDKRDLAAAKERAAEVEGKLAAGESFAELAKRYSDDPITAENGGDMGMVEAGFFGDTFDDAIAGLEIDEVSGPVETEFGLQILKVTAREKATLPTFDEVKAQLLSDLQNQEVNVLFLDQSRLLADISFEASDLTQPAEQLGLDIKVSEPFGRQGGADAITSNSRVIAEAFNEEVLELGANSELIEINPEEVLVLRVKEHRQPQQKPLEQVHDSIVQSLKAEKAREQLQGQAEQLIAQLHEGVDSKKVAEDAGLEWSESDDATRNQPGVARQLLTTAFKMPHPAEGKQAFDRTELPDGDIAVIALSQVHEGEASIDDEAQARMMAHYIAAGNGRVLFNQYVRSLKDDAKIKLYDEDK
ncbi:SurA N-terminal domain-containing protein [Endozoicomonas euniceicola]|uniref:Periplasmic chaperone PpiD n=1 Tax=Endozoicomonas euniceicola TaxID=1234143 RepID=A0ABY6GTG0_9GAMM|nr:SurA N-terminal domain-containing protein [Endozoicomonas euniceicola]UYM16058.1 SurA N-terminal domain-containing protein [Endozoicomonas euniceicola]